MEHIIARLRSTVSSTFGLKNNLERTEKAIVWEHRQAAEAYFKETMVACAIQMGTHGDFAALDNIFALLSEHLEQKKDMTESELNFLGKIYSDAEDKGKIKNGRNGTKLHTAASVSVLTRWIRHESGEGGTERGFDTMEELLRYFQEELSKDEMAFAAKDYIMAEMGKVVDAALADQVIDNEFVMSKKVNRNGRGDLKWGSVMGAVFWLGLAYKLHNKSEIREDGTEWSFGSYVEWRRGKLDKGLAKCTDELWELGSYMIEEQDAVEALEHKLCQYELLAPYAEQLFDFIDLWNVVEEWSYDETSEYEKIILHKTPQDATTEEKERELDNVLDNMERYEKTYQSAGMWAGGHYTYVGGKRSWIKGQLIGHKEEKKTAESLYQELKKAAQETDDRLKAIS